MLTAMAIKKEGSEWLPTRWILVILLFWGAFISYVVRTNLSLTMVAMVNQTALLQSISIDYPNGTTHDKHQCAFPGGQNGTDEDPYKDGPFVWSSKTQGFLQGGFFYGYACTQILGGRLSEKLGAKWLVAGGVTIGSTLALLTPTVASLGAGALMALRVLTGMSLGVFYPSANSLFSRWIPPSERCRMYSYFNAGANVGILVSMPLIGWLCDHGFAGGWPSVFYLIGGIGLAWVFFWVLLAHDDPKEHPRISFQERQYILSSLPPVKRLSVPWKAMLSSVPVWAYVAAFSSTTWIYYTRITELPTYLNSVLHLPIQKNGFINSLVTASSIVCSITAAVLGDFIINRKILSRTNTRKVMEFIALTGSSLCLVGVTFSGCDDTGVIALLTLSSGLLSFTAAGDSVLAMDLAPAFAGTIFGFGNTVCSITGFLSPLVTGYIVTGEDVPSEWHYVFYLSSAVGVFGSLIMLAFGSAKVQSWNVDQDDSYMTDIISKKPSNASIQ